jgi:hypothetical protein
VAGYRSGRSVYELAAEFRIHRGTVSKLLSHEGVPRRYRLIQGELLDRVISAYEAGRTLAQLGSEFEVSPMTIRKALIDADVTIRPRRGWNAELH